MELHFVAEWIVGRLAQCKSEFLSKFEIVIAFQGFAEN
jgi:hypothetical protein